MDKTCRNCWYNCRGKCNKLQDIFKIISKEAPKETENQDLSDKLEFIIIDDSFSCKHYK